MTRTLSLKRESLTALTTDEIAAIGGGSQVLTPVCFEPRSLAPKECLATTQDSVLACSGDCMTYGASCNC